jgi:glucose/arabinose dehydrogenase
MHTNIFRFAFLFFAIAGLAQAQTRLVPQRVALKNGKTFSLNIPTGYEIIPAAEGLKRVRFFAKAPDGRLFVTDMYNLTDNKRGSIYILDGWDEAAGKFAKVVLYMIGLHNPNSVQFDRDPSGQDWLYIAETGKLTRRKFTSGEEKPTDTKPQTIANFPDHGLSYKYGGWHLTRSIAFSPAGKLYVSVGSSCNSCVEKEAVRATVLEMDPDGKNSRVFAKGLRNAVGLKWLDGRLWATNQGSDQLGTARPDETMYALKDGADYGWPYCHSANGRIVPDPKIKRRTACRNVTRPDLVFPARSSALGFDLFDANSDAALSDSFLVSLHGSTNKAIGRGYKIVAANKGRRSRDIITGFLQRGRVVGRPCDIIRLGPDSFLFTDDHTGTVYFVRKRS